MSVSRSDTRMASARAESRGRPSVDKVNKSFRQAAKAAQCDEDEGRFRERLARVVKPDQPAEKKKPAK